MEDNFKIELVKSFMNGMKKSLEEDIVKYPSLKQFLEGKQSAIKLIEEKIEEIKEM